MQIQTCKPATLILKYFWIAEDYAGLSSFVWQMSVFAAICRSAALKDFEAFIIVEVVP